MRKKMGKITDMVYQILVLYPDARSSDRRLIEILYDEFFGVWDDPFFLVLQNRKLPSFESIRRARQKIQAQYPELRAVKPVEDERIARQEEYIEYSREVI